MGYREMVEIEIATDLPAIGIIATRWNGRLPITVKGREYRKTQRLPIRERNRHIEISSEDRRRKIEEAATATPFWRI